VSKLKYLGVEFDDYAEDFDDDGNKIHWSNICPYCANKYPQLYKDIDFESGNFACCGVCGCSYSGEKSDIGTYYIDFHPSDVEIEDIDYEVEYLDNGFIAYEGGFNTLKDALNSSYIVEKGGYFIYRRYWKTHINDKWNDIDVYEIAWKKDN
jgi:hypothetical protein